MKRILLLLMAIYCFGFIPAHSETKLFTGDTTPSLFSSMDMCSWAAPGNYVNFGTTSTPTYTEVTNNPDRTGINATDKALHLSTLQGHSWWGDFLYLTLATPITITDSTRYLHFYHYRQNLNFGFSVNFNYNALLDGSVMGTQRFDLNLANPGEWEDVVIDMKWFLDNNVPLSLITVLMDINWNGVAEPVTNYYFDEFVLNNSNMPRGIKILPDTEMSLYYGNPTSYSKWVKTLDLQNTENKDSIITNPFTTQTAVLNSTKVLQFNKSADAAWWQGVRTLLPGVFQVNNGDEYYLHLMVNIPTMDPTQNYYVVQLNAKDFAGNQIDSGDNLKYWSSDAGNWVDMVLDVTSLSYIQEFTARFDVRWDANDANISSPAGTFYMDAASIDTNPDQRTTVTAPTALVNPKTSGLKIYSTNRNIVIEGNVASIEVFNLLGVSLTNIAGNQYKTEIPVTKSGIYLVKTVSLLGKIYNSKVIVK